MTVAVLDRDYLAVTSEGLIDWDRTLGTLLDARQVLKLALETRSLAAPV